MEAAPRLDLEVEYFTRTNACISNFLACSDIDINNNLSSFGI